jgi:hypothetical protein
MEGMERSITGEPAGTLRGEWWERLKRQAPVVVADGNRRRGCLRQTLPSRAGRARTRQVAARTRGHRMGRLRRGIPEQLQIGQGSLERSTDVRGDMVTAPGPGRCRREDDHREHTKCPGDAVLRSAAGRRDHVDSKSLKGRRLEIGSHVIRCRGTMQAVTGPRGSRRRRHLRPARSRA